MATVIMAAPVPMVPTLELLHSACSQAAVQCTHYDSKVCGDRRPITLYKTVSAIIIEITTSVAHKIHLNTFIVYLYKTDYL